MTDKTRATEDMLDELHRLTAQSLLDEVRRYRNGEVLDPKTGVPLPLPAALLTAALKFLKDNGVDRAVKPGDPEDLLKDELPEFESDNVIPLRSKNG